MLSGFFARAVEISGQGAIQNIVNERAFAGARHAGNNREQPEREADGEIL